MGVSNIVTFDAHDPRVQNAVPLMGFDNVMPTYQVLKGAVAQHPGHPARPRSTSWSSAPTRAR